MKNFEPHLHVRGQSEYIDDIPEPRGLLHGVAAVSHKPKGTIARLDVRQARQSPGVVAVLTAKDVLGENQIGGIILDEPLLAEGEVHFVGQPVALVLAETRDKAREAAKSIVIDIDEEPGVFDAKEAAGRGEIIGAPRRLECGDVDAALDRCAFVVRGTAESGAQEHVYMETQGALAVPKEQDRIFIHSATQSPSAVQKICARVLGVPVHEVEVDVRRLGGAFGGKEDQATAWAALAALGARVTHRPVKVVLSRHEDMAMTGKRHPYSTDYALGLDEAGRIQAFQATYYQNAGAAADLSPAILERTLYHATAAYSIENVRVDAFSCRTNYPPFTAFRGFGGPQAFFVLEAALDHAAKKMGATREELQRVNLLKEGDRFPYGMEVLAPRAVELFDRAAEEFDLGEIKRRVDEFNEKNRLKKRGVAVTPICFGISFTSKFLNQAGALLHVYTDGSVSVSTGAVEMGQGVNVKIAHVAAETLGISAKRVYVETTNTTRVANTSPTAASTGADLNGKATELAARTVRARLAAFASSLWGCAEEEVTFADDEVRGPAGEQRLGFGALVARAYMERVSLSCQAHYATPDLYFDKAAGKGKPFAYHVFGTAVTQAEIDCLRGTYRILEVKILHDSGKSLAPKIDRGQVEGAVVQGIGWMTLEDVVLDNGRILASSLTTYKVPDLEFAPEIEVRFADDKENPFAVMGSKALGEPPFIYGIGAYFAVADALRAARPGRKFAYTAPMTTERAFLFLHGEESASE